MIPKFNIARGVPLSFSAKTCSKIEVTQEAFASNVLGHFPKLIIMGTLAQHHEHQPGLPREQLYRICYEKPVTNCS